MEKDIGNLSQLRCCSSQPNSKGTGVTNAWHKCSLWCPRVALNNSSSLKWELVRRAVNQACFQREKKEFPHLRQALLCPFCKYIQAFYFSNGFLGYLLSVQNQHKIFICCVKKAGVLVSHRVAQAVMIKYSDGADL